MWVGLSVRNLLAKRKTIQIRNLVPTLPLTTSKMGFGFFEKVTPRVASFEKLPCHGDFRISHRLPCLSFTSVSQIMHMRYDYELCEKSSCNEMAALLSFAQIPSLVYMRDRHLIIQTFLTQLLYRDARRRLIRDEVNKMRFSHQSSDPNT